MKKTLLIIPLFLIPMVSCDNSNKVTIPPACPVTSSITKDPNRQTYTINVYQVYEEVYESNEWSNPRFDVKFKFYYDQEITLSHIESSLKAYYIPKGDGYYTYDFFVYDYKNLDTKVPEKFYLTQDLIIYYGCRG